MLSRILTNQLYYRRLNWTTTSSAFVESVGRAVGVMKRKLVVAEREFHVAVRTTMLALVEAVQ